MVIDDDESILRLMKKALSLSDYEVVTLNGVEEINLCDYIAYDLIILDVMMPLNGLDICEAIRKDIKAPILFLIAKDMEEDLVKGLEVGADDYITKPFTVKELLARIGMHLRREERSRGGTAVLCFGEVSIDKATQTVLVGTEELMLTKREFALIQLLAAQPKRIFSVEEIYERLYPNSSNTLFRSISEYIYQIRSKFKPYGINPFETMRGEGIDGNCNEF